VDRIGAAFLLSGNDGDRGPASLTMVREKAHDRIFPSPNCGMRSTTKPPGEESVRGMVAAAVGQRFVAVVPPETAASFPIVVRERTLFDSVPRAPFIIVVRWRKTRSIWLPQLPAVIFSSARALRILKSSNST
jgi:hypothetical protein